RVAGQGQGVQDAPAAALEPGAILLRAATERQLEGAARAGRQVQHLEELEVLAPMVGFAAESQLAPELHPVTDRGVGPPGRHLRAAPQVQDNRLARGQEAETRRDREQAIRAAEVLAEAEEGAVRLEESDGGLATLGELELQLDRIGLQVDQPAGER